MPIFQTKVLPSIQMARKQRGGFGETDGLLVPFILLVIGLGALVAFLVMVPTKKENFSPVAPSPSGDKKEVTPAGNVILY